MARHLTSATLIDSVKRRALLPSNQVTFLDADFLAFANEEMDMAVIPYILQYHEDYYLYQVDIPLENGKYKYAIPYRAIGNKLRDVAFVDSATIFEMTRISVEDVSYYQYQGANAYSGTGYRVFYIENNEIVLLPQDATAASGTLRVWFYIRPNQLVDADRVSTITDINTTTGVVTVDRVPDNIIAGVNLDIIQTRNPHKCLAIDKVASIVDAGAGTITFNPTDLPRGLAVGDYVALAEECIIPQAPSDIHSMLAQRVACRCLEALGDQAGLQAANAKLTEMEQKGASLIDNRVEGAPLKVVNRHGFLRRLKSSFRR